MLTSIIVAYAKAPPEIYSPPDKITFDGDKITIPIFIKDNPGLMGLKLRLDYSTDSLSYPVVSSSDILSVGMFESSISNSTNGSFDVVWNNTENVSEDGNLFTIEFTKNASFISGKSIISLNYYSDDTFNEDWKNVDLKCDDIILTIDGDKTVAENITKNTQPIENTVEISIPVLSGNDDAVTEDNATQQENDNTIESKKTNIEEVDPNIIKQIFDDAIAKTTAPDIREMTEEQFSECSDNVKQSFVAIGVIVPESTDKETYIKIYSNAILDSAIADIRENIDEQTINDIIYGELKKYNAESIESLPEDKIDEFCSNIIEDINNARVDISVPQENMISLIIGLANNPQDTSYFMTYAFVPIFIVFMLILIIAILVIRRRLKNE